MQRVAEFAVSEIHLEGSLGVYSFCRRGTELRQYLVAASRETVSMGNTTSEDLSFHHLVSGPTPVMHKARPAGSTLIRDG